MTEHGQIKYPQYALPTQQWPYPQQAGQGFYPGYSYDPAYYQYYQQCYYPGAGSQPVPTPTTTVQPATEAHTPEAPPPPPGEEPSNTAPPLPSEPAPPPPQPSSTAPSSTTAAVSEDGSAHVAPGQYDAYNQYYQQQAYYAGYYQQYGYGGPWQGYTQAPNPYLQAANSGPHPPVPASSPLAAPSPTASQKPGSAPVPPWQVGSKPSPATASAPPSVSSTASPISLAVNSFKGFNSAAPGSAMIASQQGKTHTAPINFSIKPKLPKKPAEDSAAKPVFVKVEEQPAVKSVSTKSQWPPSLKSFVERAFSKCKDDPDRQKVQVVLRLMITDASEKGELWTRDWDTTPLPDVNSTPQSTEVTISVRPKGSRWSDAQPKQLDESTKGKLARVKKADKTPKVKKLLKRKQSSSDESGDEDRTQEDHKRRQRAGRFGDGMAANVYDGSKVKGSQLKKHRIQVSAKREESLVQELNWDDMIVKGTSQKLEKSYFRLTSAPDPSTVRPEVVLRRALDRLVGILRTGAEKYLYALDQFKGMRQDLTVQHIKNDLTVQVYEAHARAALEYGDTAEFNQCQTQLDILYAKGFTGCRQEFLAYRIIYQTIHAKLGEAAGLLNTLKKLTKQDASYPAVAHALKVRKAVYSGDYVAYFHLYRKAPGLGRCLMDLHVRKMRFKALDAIVRAYRPNVSIAYLARLLGFFVEQDATLLEEEENIPAGCSKPSHNNGRNKPSTDLEEAAEACLSCVAASAGVIIGQSTAEAVLDCKASVGQLVIPEDTTAVAHGDANLAIEDFLSRAILE